MGQYWTRFSSLIRYWMTQGTIYQLISLSLFLFPSYSSSSVPDNYHHNMDHGSLDYPLSLCGLNATEPRTLDYLLAIISTKKYRCPDNNNQLVPILLRPLWIMGHLESALAAPPLGNDFMAFRPPRRQNHPEQLCENKLGRCNMLSSCGSSSSRRRSSSTLPVLVWSRERERKSAT